MRQYAAALTALIYARAQQRDAAALPWTAPADPPPEPALRFGGQREAGRVTTAARLESIIRTRQQKRVDEHRAAEAEQSKAAAAKQELLKSARVRLDAKVRGKEFADILRTFGVRVAAYSGDIGSEEAEAALQKGYKRALATYHPDRSASKGLSFEETVEAEEIYKIVQSCYEEHKLRVARMRKVFDVVAMDPVAMQQQQQQQQQQPAVAVYAPATSSWGNHVRLLLPRPASRCAVCARVRAIARATLAATLRPP